MDRALGITPKLALMHIEAERLKTFDHAWPFYSSGNPSPAAMAAAGFFFAPSPQKFDDAVCFACHCSISQWDTNDIPIEEHKRWHESCPFVCGESNNIPIFNSERDKVASPAPSYPLFVSDVHGCCSLNAILLYDNFSDSSFLFLNRLFTQKYDLLMCSAPAVDFDCSGLYDARLLLNVVAHAAAEHGGQPAASLASAFSALTPSSAAAAAVQSINLSHNVLTPTISAELQQLLHRFSVLQHVNLSGNFTLGSAGVTAIVLSLAGAHCMQTYACSRLYQRKFVVIAAAGDIQSLDLSNCGIHEVSDELRQQLHLFPALEHLNVSCNPSLGSAGVTAIVSSLAGA
jgi:hypothetical protein